MNNNDIKRLNACNTLCATISKYSESEYKDLLQKMDFPDEYMQSLDKETTCNLICQNLTYIFPTNPSDFERNCDKLEGYSHPRLIKIANRLGIENPDFKKKDRLCYEIAQKYEKYGMNNSIKEICIDGKGKYYSPRHYGMEYLRSVASSLNIDTTNKNKTRLCSDIRNKITKGDIPELLHQDPSTYFSQIPKDIVGITKEYVTEKPYTSQKPERTGTVYSTYGLTKIIDNNVSNITSYEYVKNGKVYDENRRLIDFPFKVKKLLAIRRARFDHVLSTDGNLYKINENDQIILVDTNIKNFNEDLILYTNGTIASKYSSRLEGIKDILHTSYAINNNNELISFKLSKNKILNNVQYYYQYSSRGSIIKANNKYYKLKYDVEEIDFDIFSLLNNVYIESIMSNSILIYNDIDDVKKNLVLIKKFT